MDNTDTLECLQEDENGLDQYVMVIGTNSAETTFKDSNTWLYGYHNSPEWTMAVIKMGVLATNVKRLTTLPVGHDQHVGFSLCDLYIVVCVHAFKSMEMSVITTCLLLGTIFGT